MKKNVSKISKSTLSEQLYEDLQSQILSGELNKGEKLPSETALSDMYGVSRLTTRAALQKLAAVGLISIRTGEGSFVNGMNFDNIMEQISHLISQAEMDKYLPEFRTNIETQCITFAIERATDKELEHLEKLSLDMAKAASDGDIETYIQRDYKFHHYLCHISSNPLYEMVYSAIRELFLSSMKDNISYLTTEELEDGGLEKSARYHIDFVNILRSRDLKKALQELTYIINYANVERSK
nr:FadR/GntR family transcriptional regulator [uncultured Blautia sp.]